MWSFLKSYWISTTFYAWSTEWHTNQQDSWSTSFPQIQPKILPDLQQAHKLKQDTFLLAMETETNTWARCSETISTFKFTLDYNTWAANSTEEKRTVTQPIKLCSSQPGMCCVLLWGQPCEWGWGSPTAIDKDRTKNPGVSVGHLGQLWDPHSHDGVQHVCGPKTWGTIQGHVPGELSVSSPLFVLWLSWISFFVSLQAEVFACVPKVFFVILSQLVIFLTVKLLHRSQPPFSEISRRSTFLANNLTKPFTHPKKQHKKLFWIPNKFCINEPRWLKQQK